MLALSWKGYPVFGTTPPARSRAYALAKNSMLNSIIKRVDVYRNYELNVELNMNIRQFFLGMEETKNIPITT